MSGTGDPGRHESESGHATEGLDGDPSHAFSSTQLAEMRTYLAAERTLFAVLRTGLSIAGGGSLVITLLGDSWPRWVQAPLVAVFLVIGYSIAFLGLQRYRGLAVSVERERQGERQITSSAAMTVVTIALHIVVTVVVVLFLVSAFE